MLKVKKFLNILHNILLIFALVITGSMFYVRYKMYNLTNSLSYLDKKIEKLQNEKELLTIELTYLTSTERIMALIEKNPNILNDKDVIKVAQLKTIEEFENVSLAKAKNRAYENKKIAKNQTINDIVEREI